MHDKPSCLGGGVTGAAEQEGDNGAFMRLLQEVLRSQQNGSRGGPSSTLP